jgi:membrane protein
MVKRALILRDRLLGWLWRESEQDQRSHRALVRIVRLLFAVGRDLAAGQLTLRAMSLVYTTLLSLIPLLAISFSILKGFGVHNQIEPFLLAALEPLGERSEEIARQMIEFVDNMQVGVLGVVGFVLLFFTVMSLMQKIERAFNEVWQVLRERSLGERFRDYMSVIVIGPVLVFASLGITASLFGTTFVQSVASTGPLGWLVEFGGRLVPIVMIVAAFTFIYMFVPNTRVRFIPAFWGGLVAGLLWNILGVIFAAFVASAARYAAIYSGFATLIFFMIWLYVGWLVLLIGASIAFYRQNPEYLAGRRLATNLSFLERERIALHALAMIGERFYGARPAVSAEDMALELHVPADVVEHLLATLASVGLVAPTDEAPPRFLPACPWDQAPLSRAIEAVRQARGGGLSTDLSVERQSVSEVMAALQQMTRDAFDGVSLKDFAIGVAGISAIATTTPTTAGSGSGAATD